MRIACRVYKNFFHVTLRPKAGHGLLVLEISRSHSDAPQSVGFLWTSDHSGAEISTWQHVTITTHRLPCARWDSKPQSSASERLQTYALARASTDTDTSIWSVVFISANIFLLQRFIFRLKCFRNTYKCYVQLYCSLYLSFHLLVFKFL